MLTLAPLKNCHEVHYLHLLTEGDIATICKLDHLLEGDIHWSHWLSEMQSSPYNHPFAVVHSEYGFIGSVSIEVVNGVGLFYYWIGKPFQRQGYGAYAARQLLGWAEQQLDMHSCYAKVLGTNLPSLKTLKNLNFRSLPIDVVTQGEAPECLFYYGPKKSAPVCLDEINRFFRCCEALEKAILSYDCVA